MKIGKKQKAEAVQGGFSKAAMNEAKRNSWIVGISVVTVLLIVWVLFMGRQAQQTVTVAVMSQNVYKNQVITQEMVEPYEMLKGEYEKFSIVQENGTKQRRVILWEEIGEIINSFAAYPLQKGEYAEYRNFVKARLDNTDSVLYTFPGKELVPLDVGKNELRTFKTFLEPGDKLNIQAIFSEKVTQKVPDGYGGMTNQQVEVFRTETLFQDIMVADLLNQSGQSILDIYADYNDRTVWQQAQMDSSADFQESTEPQTLIVALTPEETERYYYYKSKSNAEFKVSLPQRTE